MISYFLLLCIYAKADFEVDNFTYHIIDQEKNDVQVVKCTISSESSLIIPSTVFYESTNYKVTSIAANAFSSQFEKIYFPYTLIEIDGSAFSWFDHLQSIGFINENNELINDTLPPKMTKINEKVFFHCEAITTIDVNNVIELKPYCFQYCFHLTSLKLRKVEIIGEFSLFSTNLSEVIEFPSTLKEIHDHAFVSSYVTEITGEVPNLKIINGAFNECSELKHIPKLTGIVRIENFAFAGCYKLKEVHCGPNLTSISYSCFNGCGELVSFTTESKNYTIAERAFCVCSSLPTFNFEGVTEILDNAFEACYSFVEIDMSNSHLEEVLPIFQDCVNLTSIVLPQNLTKFDLKSFEECNIQSFTFSGTKGTLNLKGTFYQSQIDLCEVIFSPSCNVILDSTFASCYQLSRVVLPKTPYELHSTFVNCHNLKEVENLEFCTLLDNSFFSCEKLTQLNSFPPVKTIGKQTFMNCKSLESIPSLSSVEVIESRCFSNCLKLKKIECGSELKSIGSQAFSDCSLLLSFTTSSLNYSIDFESFQRCNSLQKFDFSGCCEIQHGAFDHCTSLFEIDLSKSKISSLPYNAFSDCSSLHDITFKSDLEYIGEMCFYNCINITSLHFSSLKYIHSNAFEFCIGLKTVTFENQPLVISSNAFHSCVSLETIELKNSEPNSNSIIENRAFENCTSLKSFQFDKWSISSIGELAFHGCHLSHKLKFKGSSVSTNFTIFDHAFSSSLIQSVDFRFDFTSLILSNESFVECSDIKCVMIDSKHKNAITEVFKKKIINGLHCPNYLHTHIVVLVVIILSVLAVVILIVIIIIICVKRKKLQNEKYLSQPLITTQ